MQLFLVRHPKPLVAPGICYGRSDLAVADRELDAVASRLMDAGLPGLLPVHASPLLRCAALAYRLGPAPILDIRLAEMNFGHWEMQSWDAIARHEIDAWSEDLVDYRPGGGESVRDVVRRVAHWLDQLRRSGSGDACVICHAGTMRVLHALHATSDPAQAARQAAASAHQIGYGEVMLLDF